MEPSRPSETRTARGAELAVVSVDNLDVAMVLFLATVLARLDAIAVADARFEVVREVLSPPFQIGRAHV